VSWAPGRLWAMRGGRLALHIDGPGRSQFDIRMDPGVLEPPANIDRLLIAMALCVEALPKPEERPSVFRCAASRNVRRASRSSKAYSSRKPWSNNC
jgi:hypothetical protein